jgi:hypothetical protein
VPPPKVGGLASNPTPQVHTRSDMQEDRRARPGGLPPSYASYSSLTRIIYAALSLKLRPLMHRLKRAIDPVVTWCLRWREALGVAFAGWERHGGSRVRTWAARRGESTVVLQETGLMAAAPPTARAGRA